MKKLRNVVIAGILFVASFVLVGFMRDPDIYFLIKKNFTIFSEVYREVSLHYVDKVNPTKLMRKGIDAMLESLDPYTVLFDESDNQNMEIITRGSYGGVGLDVGYRGGKIVVIAPMEGYSAYRKGIRTGDVIIAVDGVSVESMSPDQVQNLTTGQPGTSVTLQVRRYGIDHPLTFKLERQRIEVKNIAYSGLVGEQKDVGYIMLSRFSQNTAEEIRNAIQKLQSRTKLGGLILDLRNNPGGLLDEAVGTVDKFIPPGVKVVETRGRLSQHNDVFRTRETALAPDLPLVILQNGGSASASEIVAGALQDLDRAVIMGQQSFGKGLVQVVRHLSYNTALKITTARYYIPSGRSIQSVTYTHDSDNNVVKKPDSLRKAFTTRDGRTVYDGNGITPDVKIPEPHPTLLQSSLQHQNQYFDFANQYAATHDSLAVKIRSDKLFKDFTDFLYQRNFHYQIPSEAYLSKIDSSLNGQNIESDIKAIRQNIEEQKKKAFDNQRYAIEKDLYIELLARYKGEREQKAAQLPYDKLVKQAVNLLHNPARYNSILAGPK
ncbi:MAG TPA: S41 family peptidase [Balneolaceae bacterium]|nr:S41 family peptidase [Balneolaceae bacterium]